jgi:hypothetical protein
MFQSAAAGGGGGGVGGLEVPPDPPQAAAKMPVRAVSTNAWRVLGRTVVIAINLRRFSALMRNVSISGSSLLLI